MKDVGGGVKVAGKAFRQEFPSDKPDNRLIDFLKHPIEIINFAAFKGSRRMVGMKRITAATAVGLIGCAVLILGGSAQGDEALTNAPAAKVRIGIYDSRSLAIAYAGSAPLNQWLRRLRAEHDKAKAAGNQTRAAQLEAEGAAGQRLLHMQGFSTAPVTNILEQIKDKLPAIQEQAGVSVLVSKWDTAALARYRGSNSIDVTTALVDALNPSELQRKRALEIQNHKPISLKEAEQMD